MINLSELPTHESVAALWQHAIDNVAQKKSSAKRQVEKLKTFSNNIDSYENDYIAAMNIYIMMWDTAVTQKRIKDRVRFLSMIQTNKHEYWNLEQVETSDGMTTLTHYQAMRTLTDTISLCAEMLAEGNERLEPARRAACINWLLVHTTNEAIMQIVNGE